MKFRLFVVSVLSFGLGIGLLPLDKVNAVTASDWKAGNIMTDSIFMDENAMSTSSIQSWLNARLKNCDYNGTQRSELGGGRDYNGNGVVSRAEWARTKGYPTKFTCLNSYYEVPKTTPKSGVPKSNYASSTRPNGSKSAAQLINDAAKAYNISPKVLLVKLGTESAGPLTSDVWPLHSQYRYAMGARCPDSGPGGSANCDTTYAGFSIQMREAAKLLRGYLDNMDKSWWSYKKPYKTNYVLWNVVERNCGGRNVYIENKATAALYTYTPYQPNSAALRNMYGTGDNCSAYGNRNFWRVFNDWFGSTRTKVQSYSYKFEKLVGDSNSVLNAKSLPVGDHTSTVSVNNNIYSFYYDTTNQSLRYSRWNGSQWSDHLVDGNGAGTSGAVSHNVGQHVKAITNNGKVYLYYYDATSGDLRHGWMESGGWKLQTLDGASNAVNSRNIDVGRSIEAFIHNGRIQVYYYSVTTKSIEHAWTKDGMWRFETLEGTSNAVKSRISDVGSRITGVSRGNQIQLFYYNADHGNLEHAWWDGKKWSFEAFDGSSNNSLGRSDADVGSGATLTLYNGQLQLFYYDKSNGELQHAWWTGSRWGFETMDGSITSVLKNDATNVGDRVVAKQFGKDLFVFYYDKTLSSWRYAYWNGVWNKFVLDGSSGSKSGGTSAVGGRLSLATYENTMQIFYRGAGGNLQHAWIRR